MANKVKTLEESLREARGLAAMYKDLIRHGEAREEAIAAEARELLRKRAFLRKARLGAPMSLQRAEASVSQLEAQQRANESQGLPGPSRATLQRKRDRADALMEKLAAMAEELRAAGLDPQALMRQAADAQRERADA